MTRHIDAATAPLDPDPLPADAILEGSPATTATAFTSIGETSVGVWEITTGVVRDVEVDEAFVVLAGAGTITFATGEIVELAPGSLVRLHAGEETVWDISAPLRKVYIA